MSLYVYKYKNNSKIIQVSRDGSAKSTQTRVVGKITNKVHFFQVPAGVSLKKKVGTHIIGYFPYCPCLCTFLHYHATVLTSIIFELFLYLLATDTFFFTSARMEML